MKYNLKIKIMLLLSIAKYKIIHKIHLKLKITLKVQLNLIMRR
jgi:hypothetical protein